MYMVEMHGELYVISIMLIVMIQTISGRALCFNPYDRSTGITARLSQKGATSQN